MKKHFKMGPAENTPIILTSAQVNAFRRKIYTYYNQHGRDLPWRTTNSPYNILVSEIMLQQTQVDRVISKYLGFIRRFPSFAALAHAPVADILSAWQGLGYNRRALMLQKCACEVIQTHNGQLPTDPAVLRTLPGIGPATSASIAAFAFNLPTIFIETNIRTVFIHLFFPDSQTVPDTLILPLVAQTLDHRHPARWYNALMDYGVMLKKKHGNPSRRSAHYATQSKFEGSDRQIRGRIIKLLVDKKYVDTRRLLAETGVDADRLAKILSALVKEGFVSHDSTGYRIR